MPPRGGGGRGARPPPLWGARGGGRVLRPPPRPSPRHKACSEYLSPATTAVLERLGAGVLEQVEGAAHAKLYGMKVVAPDRSEEHTSELQSLAYLVCRLLLEKKKKQ